MKIDSTIQKKILNTVMTFILIFIDIISLEETLCIKQHVMQNQEKER